MTITYDNIIGLYPCIDNTFTEYIIIWVNNISCVLIILLMYVLLISSIMMTILHFHKQGSQEQAENDKYVNYMWNVIIAHIN